MPTASEQLRAIRPGLVSNTYPQAMHSYPTRPCCSALTTAIIVAPSFLLIAVVVNPLIRSR